MPKANPTPAVQRRVRGPKALPRESSGEQPFAKVRDLFQGMSDGELVSIVIASNAWKEVMVPLLGKIDEERMAARKNRGGFPIRYTSEMLELVMLLKEMAGTEHVKDAIVLLSGGDNRDRVALGFKPELMEGHPRPMRSRKNPHRLPKTSCLGVPSEATLSRHNERFPKDDRDRAYDQLLDRLQEEHASDPEFIEEARELYMDGFELPTRHTAPSKEQRATGDMTGVTCPDGGIAAIDKNGKGGHGMKVVVLVTSTGLTLGHHTTRMTDGESDPGRTILERLREKRATKLGPNVLRVLVTDALYGGRDYRSAARAAGLIERTNFASTGPADESKRNRKKRDAFRYRIEGHPNWHANGHREVECTCGARRRPAWRADVDESGHAWSRLQGDCPTCGTIHITAGQWKLHPRSQTFVRCVPADPDVDLAFGNGLTFNSPLSARFGKNRMGRNEGANGVLVTRFGFGAGKQSWRTKTDVDVRIKMIACIEHALAMAHRANRRAVAQGLAPPIAA